MAHCCPQGSAAAGGGDGEWERELLPGLRRVVRLAQFNLKVAVYRRGCQSAASLSHFGQTYMSVPKGKSKRDDQPFRENTKHSVSRNFGGPHRENTFML